MKDTTGFMEDLNARYRAVSGLTERRHYSIFYSRVEPSPLFILGFNPGGNPESWDESQLASRTYYENSEHEYVDCHYRIAVAMREYLISALRLPTANAIRSIPKSNLIFRRSAGQSSLSIRTEEALQESQLFVEEMLVRVSPTFILLEGLTTLEQFERVYCTDTLPECDGPPITTPNGRNKARIYRADVTTVRCLSRPVRLIGIGHPSKYAGRQEWSAVVKRSRCALEGCRVAA